MTFRKISLGKISLGKICLRRSALFIALAALAPACAAPPPAEAQGRPLTIRKRGAVVFLPGRVVEPGSLSTWASASTDAAPVWSNNDRFRGASPRRW